MIVDVIRLNKTSWRVALFDDLIAFYNENVVNAFTEYRDLKDDGVAGRSRDIRSAIRAVNAVFHFREHIDAPNVISRTQAEAQCAEYGIIADIANATKHKTLTGNTPHGAPYLSDASQLSERVIVTMYEDGDGEYRHTEKTVVAKLNDGVEHHLIELLTTVMNFWEHYLHSAGLIPDARTFITKRPQHPLTREQCADSCLNLEMVKGHRFLQNWMLQKYNADVGVVESVDLTGSEIKFSVYEPPKMMIDLALTHQESGDVFRDAVELTDEQRQRVIDMDSDEDRQRYIQSLPQISEAMEQLGQKIADHNAQDGV